MYSKHERIWCVRFSPTLISILQASAFPQVSGKECHLLAFRILGKEHEDELATFDGDTLRHNPKRTFEDAVCFYEWYACLVIQLKASKFKSRMSNLRKAYLGREWRLSETLLGQGSHKESKTFGKVEVGAKCALLMVSKWRIASDMH